MDWRGNPCLVPNALGSAMEVLMRPTGRSVRKVIVRIVGFFLLGVFLQWAGMTNPASQDGTLYADIAHLVGAGPSGGAVAKLPPQQ
jgi:hypothetical protein